MSRHITSRNNGPHMGVISCARPRCRWKFTWELEHPYNGHINFIESRNMTDEQLAEKKEQDRQAWAEVYGKPLPADWVKVRYMLYVEGDKGNPDTFEFHNPHCAALYLNSLPAAKGNQDIRRVRA